jgi:hypothetical protein
MRRECEGRREVWSVVSWVVLFVVCVFGTMVAQEASTQKQAVKVSGSDSGSSPQPVTATDHFLGDASQVDQTGQQPAPPKQPVRPLHIVPFLGGQDIKHAMPGLFAPPGTHMAYFGGLVIPDVHVVQVLYGTGNYLSNVSSTAPPSVASFFNDVTQSSYMDLLSEYTTTGVVPTDGGASSNQPIGHGFFDGQFTITPSAANNSALITDNQIQGELLNQVTAGNLPAPVLDAQGNNTTLYMVYFPQGKTITVGNISSCARGGFCAYHNSTVGKFGTRSLYYGVLPDMQPPSACSTGCGSTDPFQNVTIVTSHELAEAITDADVGTATSAGRPLAWADPNTGAEIGDVCTGLPANVSVNGNNYAVQQEWSNLQNECVGFPMTFFFDFPPTVLPGSVFGLTVNAPANYRGTVHFTSSDPAAVLPADYTYTFADAGNHSFLPVLHGSGTQTITVSDTQFPYTGTANILMRQPATVSFLVVGVPDNAVVGVPVTVGLRGMDAFGNLITTYNGTIHFTSSDLAATLPPDTTLVNGIGSVQVTFNAQGTQSLTAADVATPSITTTINFNVLAPATDSTTTALTVSPNPSSFGQPVTFTATVTGGTTPISGTVGFNVGGSATLVNGQGQVTLTLPAGTYTAYANYFGTNQRSSSAPVVVNINPAPTTVTLTSSQSSGNLGDHITFTANVSSPVTLVDSTCGSVFLNDGTSPIAEFGISPCVNGASVSLTTSSLPVGPRNITASFSGNSNFAASTSAVLVQTVNPAGSPDYSLTASAASATVSAGQAANFSITAQSLNGFTGTIKFSCGNLPALTTCTFLPSTEFVVTAGFAMTNVTVKTTGPHASLIAPAVPRRSHATYAALWGFTPFAFAMVLLVGARRRIGIGVLPLALLAVLTITAFVGCGGGGSTPPPPPPPPHVTPAGTTTFNIITTATPASGPATTTTKQLSLGLTVLQ